VSQARIARAVEADIVAVSVGDDARWSWRIVTRGGQLLQESADTYSSLSDALMAGRRYLDDASSAPGDSPA
jgi:hypothetical protein